MTRSLALLLVFGFGVCAAAHAQTTTAADAALVAEFPAYDLQLLTLEQRGLGNAAASHALATSPDTIGTLKLLLAQNRTEDAIAVTKRILAEHPNRTLPALTAIAQDSYRFSDQARGQRDALQQIAAQARRRLATLAREDAARLERQIIRIELRQPSVPGADAYDEMLDDFVKKYDGTEAALLTRVDVLVRGRASWQQLDALDAFARAHPRSVAAAKALFEEGWQLTVNIPITGVEPRGSDPTDRFLRVRAIVRELESGSYPACEWVERAPELVTGFFASNPTFRPGNAARLASEYVAFVREHMPTAGPDVASSRLGYLVTTQLATLFKTQGDAVAIVEGVLDTLAKDTGKADFTYLKAAFLLRTGIDEPSQRTAVRARARDVLRALSESGGDLPHRKALATLACLELEDGDHADALTVKTADGTQSQLVLRDPFPGLDDVLFTSGEQIQMLNGVITALGGTKRFVPASVMATPNQPAGPAVDVIAFWNDFFPARPGHWGGWEFEAYPRITSIEFLDAARTKAAVPVTIGYAGATVVLEKRDGVWRAMALVNEWIT